MDFKKILKYGSVIIITILLAFAVKIYLEIFTDNTKFEQEEIFVYIPTDSNYEQVKEIIAPFVKNIDNFESIAQKRNYPQNVKAGKFTSVIPIYAPIEGSVTQVNASMGKFMNASDVILEVGSGGGYTTSVLANLVNSVYSIEQDKDIYDLTIKNIKSICH